MAAGYFLYLFGAPGSGKSTLVRELTKGLRCNPEKKPLAHLVWEARRRNGAVIELGGRRASFSGTDVMPLNIQPRAKAFMEAQPAPLMFAEGDRLANEGFFEAVLAAGYALSPVYVDPPPDVAHAWRQGRAERLGKAQDESWVKGRISKARGLAEKYECPSITSVELEDRMLELYALENPVVAALAQ